MNAAERAAPAAASLRHGPGKTVVLDRGSLRHPVVAAVVGAEVGTHGQGFKPAHAPDMSVERHAVEIAGREP